MDSVGPARVHIASGRPYHAQLTDSDRRRGIVDRRELAAPRGVERLRDGPTAARPVTVADHRHTAVGGHGDRDGPNGSGRASPPPAGGSAPRTHGTASAGVHAVQDGERGQRGAGAAATAPAGHFDPLTRPGPAQRLASAGERRRPRSRGRPESGQTIRPDGPRSAVGPSASASSKSAGSSRPVGRSAGRAPRAGRELDPPPTSPQGRRRPVRGHARPPVPHRGRLGGGQGPVGRPDDHRERQGPGPGRDLITGVDVEQPQRFQQLTAARRAAPGPRRRPAPSRAPPARRPGCTGGNALITGAVGGLPRPAAPSRFSSSAAVRGGRPEAFDHGLGASSPA